MLLRSNEKTFRILAVSMTRHNEIDCADIVKVCTCLHNMGFQGTVSKPSFKHLASGAHWPTIVESAFVSVPVLRSFFVQKFAPYFLSDAYYSVHVHYPKAVNSIRAVERAYCAQGFAGCVGSFDTFLVCGTRCA